MGLICLARGRYVQDTRGGNAAEKNENVRGFWVSWAFFHFFPWYHGVWISPFLVKSCVVRVGERRQNLNVMETSTSEAAGTVK